MAAPTVDAGYLAASYSVPETTLQSLLSTPTVELVQSLLTQIEAKARAHDDLQSEKIRTDVELEAAVQGGEQRARTLKATAEKAQKEAEELKKKLVQEENARLEAETALHNLQASASSSTSETQALESRIKTLESHNRDAIAMHEAKTAAHDRLAQELSEQHQKSVELRKHVSTLEEQNQSLESAATNVKFREANLQQEIEQLRNNNDWYTTELKTRADEHSRYRKEKNAQIAQLQRENADAAETIDTLRRTETLLRQHIEELKNKAEEDRIRIEELESAASAAEANFHIEVDGARRLAALHQQNNEMTKKRLEQLQVDSERSQEDAAHEIGILQADMELERTKATEAEARLAELETLVESLKSDNSDLRSSVRIPGTPRHGMNGGSFSTPGRAGSPAVFSPGGSHLKTDASKTQLLIENNDLKKELRRVREKQEEQAGVLHDMLQELERRGPEFDELRRQNEALLEQSADLSNLLEEAGAEREAAQRESRKSLGDLEGVQNECALLHRQVQDMTIQLRMLLWRREAEENGLNSLPPDQQKAVIATMSKNELPDELIPQDSLTQRMITKHLVLFNNIAEVQQQNAELLRTIRQVGEESERQESRMQSDQYQKDVNELNQLRSLVADKDEEIKSLNIRSHTLKTERDMYSRIVNGRGQLPPHSQSTSAFAQSVPATGAPFMLGNGSQSHEVPDYSKLIKDLQSHIDLLKEESATDRATLKSQVDGLTKDNSQLQSDKLRFESQVRREQDRYARLEGSIKLLQSEKDSIQDRYNRIQATMAQQDDRLVKATQNAAEAEARLQSLQGEMVQLKASQQMSATIEARLKERNQELMTERDRLSNMVSSIQSLRNEAELATAESRRELQNNVDKLRADLQNAERKLENEMDEHKKATQQRDYERTEAQRRIDDLITARNSVEVKAATVESTRQQLEQRIKDLQSQLHSAEERIRALQPRQTNEEQESASREEELTAQVSELQRKIERQNEDLEATTSQIATFQEVAQEAEDRLQAFVEAHERLQEQLNLAQQEKDATISDLQQRVEDISSELATSSTELTELRGQHEQHTLVLRQQKDILEAEITRLNNEMEDYKVEAENQTQFVKTQGDIAKRAQDDYDHELKKHAEAMERLEKMREQRDQLQSEMTQFKTQAEAARTALEQSQEHWKSTEGRYEEQIAEARRRHDDLKQYNQTLLNQFDEYKEQINSLKSDRSAASPGDAGSGGPSSSNLQDIETYLRREKEILEVQLNLKTQESKRLEQQLTHAQAQLDQTREKLLEEQAKASGSQSNSSLANIEKNLEQLNVYRESNATLRSQNERLEVQFTEKAKALEDLQSELEPLQVRVSELEGELELNNGHLKTVQEDRDRWQKRHQDVLQRYDRIDPKDLEDLKTQIEDHKAERDQALEQVTGLNEQITDLTGKLEKAAETKDAAVKEARDKFNRIHSTRMNEKKEEIQKITAERDDALKLVASLQQELAVAQQQVTKSQSARSDASQSQERLATLQKELQQAHAQLATTQQDLAAAKAARDEALAPANASAQPTGDTEMGEEGQINEGEYDATAQHLTDLQKQLEEAQQKAKDAEDNRLSASNERDSLQAKLSIQKGEFEKLEKDAVENSTTIVELRQQLSEAQSHDTQPAPIAATTEPATDSAMSTEIENFKEELAAKAKEIVDLQTALDNANATISNANQESTTEAKAESEQPAKPKTKTELDEREAELNTREASLSQRDQKLKGREDKNKQLVQSLNDKLKAARAQFEGQVAELDAKHKVELERLQQEKEAAQGASKDTKAEPEGVRTTETVPDGIVNTDDLARPTVTESQLAGWLKNNAGALRVVKKQIQNNVTRQTASKDEMINKLRQEIEQANAQKAIDAITNPVKQEAGQAKPDWEEERAKLDAEWEKKLVLKETNMVKMAEMKAKLKDGNFATLKAKFGYVEKAAKETPAEEVAKVYAIAVTQKATKNDPATQPATPAKPAFVQPVPNTSTPQQQLQTATSANNTPQANGATDAPAAQVPQPVPFQQPSPFIQAAGHGIPANPFLPGHQQMGRGLAQPGFAVQGAAQAQQPHQQQFGVGNGSQAIRGVLSSNIPRGGASNIPMPGGRGRGQNQQQQQPNPQLHQNQQSNIGRGGGRGGRGRGNQPNQQGGQNQSSPRTSLNPGAAGFQPGQQGGRGQKRGAEDEGDGSTIRGGKRQRGGRGGGGAPAQGE